MVKLFVPKKGLINLIPRGLKSITSAKLILGGFVIHYNFLDHIWRWEIKRLLR